MRTKATLLFSLSLVAITMFFNPPKMEIPSKDETENTELGHNEEPNYRSSERPKQKVIKASMPIKPKVATKEKIDIQLSRTYENAVHESAHYIVYMKKMELLGVVAYPIEASIIPGDNNGGHFTCAGTTDLGAEILINYSGYATRVVFFGESTRSVFDEMRSGKYTDFMITRKKRGKRTVSEFDDFVAAIEWVRKYRNEIALFAIRLQKEKIIKF